MAQMVEHLPSKHEALSSNPTVSVWGGGNLQQLNDKNNLLKSVFPR
jgi:hypothetical protein